MTEPRTPRQMAADLGSEALLTPNHTPGPWRLSSPVGEFGFEYKAHRAVVADSHVGTHTEPDNIEHYGGALVCESIRTPENARLIAAAPDLLDIVRTIVLVCDSGTTAHAALALDDNSPLVGKARDLIRFVIAGEERRTTGGEA